MKPCCGFGKILYISSMFISVVLTIAALLTPQWISKPYSDNHIANQNIALLDADPYIYGYLKAQWYYGAIVWALIADVIAFFNFTAFGLACSRPTQCYLAMRRSAVISCYVFGQFLCVIIAFPIELKDKNESLGVSYFLLCGAEATALIGAICGYVTSQIMYNALERSWNKKYSIGALCLPY